MQTASKKVINNWAMYDWANSVYNLVITSTIFPNYFEAMTKEEKVGNIYYVTFLGRKFVNTSLYTYILAFAFIIVALILPILTSVADYKGNKKKFLAVFCTMGSIACASLVFYDDKNLALGVSAIIIACIGYWSSLVFYNSYLPEIASVADRDRVSARGFAYGYLGSMILQTACFVLVFFPGLVGGRDADAATGEAGTNIQFRLGFLMVGIWWMFFGLRTIRRLPASQPAGSQNQKNWLTNGYRELKKVWRQLIHLPVLKRFLTAFFFYNMGVQTVMLAATLYGKNELAIPTNNLIIAILLIQFVAIPGAFAISKLSEKVGNLKALMFCIAVWVSCCITAYLIPKGGVIAFDLLAVAVGFVMGGIQSLSRSTYAKLMPETRDTASFFSFYDVTEKIAIVIGMFSFGLLTEITGSQRTSVLALMSFFILGGLFLWLTQQAQRKHASPINAL
jgi:MFS transporter, UMF1 family